MRVDLGEEGRGRQKAAAPGPSESKGGREDGREKQRWDENKKGCRAAETRSMLLHTAESTAYCEHRVMRKAPLRHTSEPTRKPQVSRGAHLRCCK